MRITRRSALTTFAAFAAFFSSSAKSDGAHAAFTIIEHNPRAGTIEIIHRLMALDLELALTARLGNVVQLDDNDETDALLEEYVNEYFWLSPDGGEAINVDWVGSEVIGTSVIAYQEAPWDSDTREIRVYNQILTDAHPTQVNTVNVTFNRTTQTRMFMANDQAQSIVLAAE